MQRRKNSCCLDFPGAAAARSPHAVREYPQLGHDGREGARWHGWDLWLEKVMMVLSSSMRRGRQVAPGKPQDPVGSAAWVMRCWPHFGVIHHRHRRFSIQTNTAPQLVEALPQIWDARDPSPCQKFAAETQALYLKPNFLALNYIFSPVGSII